MCAIGEVILNTSTATTKGVTFLLKSLSCKACWRKLFGEETTSLWMHRCAGMLFILICFVAIDHSLAASPPQSNFLFLSVCKFSELVMMNTRLAGSPCSQYSKEWLPLFLFTDACEHVQEIFNKFALGVRWFQRSYKDSCAFFLGLKVSIKPND